MTDIKALIAANKSRWDHMHLDPHREASVRIRANVLCRPENKVRFVTVADAIKAQGLRMEWWFVAICSEREAGGPPDCWHAQIAQGDPLGAVSHHDPAGRGPFLDHPGEKFDAFTRGCFDGLIDCAPHAAHWPDWSAGGVLTLWEEYNGLGYAARGVPSAYVWSASDQYVSGKFVADHVYRAGVVDVQEGCAPLIKCMADIDASIKFGGPSTLSPTTPIKLPPTVIVPPVPGIAPAHKSLWQLLYEEFEHIGHKD